MKFTQLFIPIILAALSVSAATVPATRDSDLEARCSCKSVDGDFVCTGPGCL
jgi:hypothetical protein